MAYRALTQPQIELARQRQAAGETLIEIAADLGVHRRTVSEAIRGKRYYTTPLAPGQPRKAKYSTEQVQNARAKYAAGESISSIARELGCGVTTAHDMIKRISYDWVR